MTVRSMTHSLFALAFLASAACGSAGSDIGGDGADTEATTPPPVSVPPTTGEPDDAAATETSAGNGVAFAELPNGCDLVSEEEVASVLGNPVEANPLDVSCMWFPVDPEDGLSASVTLVPQSEQACVEGYEALGATEMFEYEQTDLAVPAFRNYNETLAGTFVATIELCTPQVNVGVRVEGSEENEDSHIGLAEQLVPLVLERLQAALGS